ncbi:MAG: hypothetical protein KatS3mg016_1698 [Fimbriimonadales bacterium]|nr:MAG: hypothetical protein KatS3mg016_1698 [Fimbriimonadales bacterium]
MKGLTKLSVLGALCALIAAGAYAQPPGLAGLVWLDDKVEFDMNAGNLVATGAISTTIALGNQNPVCITKSPSTLDINLDLSALTGISGLPTVTLTGTALSPTQVQWTVGNVLINQCVTISGTNVLIKRITGGKLTVDLTLLGSPYNSSVCGDTFYVRGVPTGGNAQNFLNVEAYAFCVESRFHPNQWDGSGSGLCDSQWSCAGACQPVGVGQRFGEPYWAAPTREKVMRLPLPLREGALPYWLLLGSRIGSTYRKPPFKDVFPPLQAQH